MAEVAELKDQRLRMAAEMENLRRRTAREIKDAKSYAISGFARDMLQVSDNLQRALAAVPDQAEDAIRQRPQDPHRRCRTDRQRAMLSDA
jgi:molecular chaperone GrpE